MLVMYDFEEEDDIFSRMVTVMEMGAVEGGFFAWDNTKLRELVLEPLKYKEEYLNISVTLFVSEGTVRVHSPLQMVVVFVVMKFD